MPYRVPDAIHEPLYAIVPYFNPWRWKTREKHTTRALKHFHDSGATIIFVEIAFNRRDFAFADLGLDGTYADCGIHDKRYRHRHLQFRTKDELWLKENAINVGIGAAPYDAQNFCWLDSDIHFLRPNWVGECTHKLQHYKFLQMFSHARDLAPDYELLPEDYPHADGISWMEGYRRGILPDRGTLAAGDYYGARAMIGGKPAQRVWPGLAWAATREGLEDVGGLLDIAVWGGGDWHMAHALIERKQNLMHPGLSRNYQAAVWEWFNKCKRDIRRNVGCMTGTVVHHWHGRKTERGYAEKHRLLAQYGFDPVRHLKRDAQGLWQLHDDGSAAYVQLRDTMREIAFDRNEDSPEIGIPMLSRDNH